MTMPRSPWHDIESIRDLMAALPYAWAFCGGWAIDIWLGQVMREHKDVDIAIWREDQLAIQAYLAERGWTMKKAGSGKLIPWEPDEYVDLPVHIIWCRNPEHDPDFLEILFEQRAEGRFRYRRDQRILLPEANIFQTSAQGWPYLAPEVALLYKSKRHEVDENAADFANTAPLLSAQQRAWLRASIALLDPHHPWLEMLV
jgi:hypothetical protein